MVNWIHEKLLVAFTDWCKWPAFYREFTFFISCLHTCTRASCARMSFFYLLGTQRVAIIGPVVNMRNFVVCFPYPSPKFWAFDNIHCFIPYKGACSFHPWFLFRTDFELSGTRLFGYILRMFMNPKRFETSYGFMCHLQNGWHSVTLKHVYRHGNGPGWCYYPNPIPVSFAIWSLLAWPNRAWLSPHSIGARLYLSQLYLRLMFSNSWTK